MSHRHQHFAIANGQERGFVHDFRQLRPRSPRASKGNELKIYRGCQWDPLGMDTQDRFTATRGGQTYIHMSIKSSGTTQSGIENVGSIRRCNANDTNLDFKQHAGIDFDVKSRMREAKILNSRPLYSSRKVSLAMRVTPDEARFVVKDEGSGFDVKEVSSLGLTQSLRGDFGQGLFLMWAFMDKVVFDRKGSTVTLVKHFERAETETPTETTEATAKDAMVLLHYGGGKKIFAINKERATIGRDESCDVRIDASNVSHHHCLLFLHEGWWFVRDLKSTNGIKVNGERTLSATASIIQSSSRGTL